MNIVVLGDIHYPFNNEKATSAAIKLVKALKPTHIVQIGDLYDQYCFSRFTRKNIILPEQELEEARARAEEMWKSLRSTGARCFQILGNHDIRLIKRVEEKLPEAQTLVRRSMLELYQFKGVRTIEDDRQELIINGILFLHGYRSRLGDHMRYNRQSTVVGHSHVGGVVYEQYRNRILWELNVGYLADETAEPLKYRPQTTSKWTLGLGVIDTKGPRFIPL